MKRHSWGGKKPLQTRVDMHGLQAQILKIHHNIVITGSLIQSS